MRISAKTSVQRITPFLWLEVKMVKLDIKKLQQAARAID
jgi:hypothetical protein